MDILITDEDKSFKLSETSIVPLRFIVSSVEQNNLGIHLENHAGMIDVGIEDLNRKITIPFFFKGQKVFEFPLIRDELFGMFGKKSFFIMEIPAQGGLFTGKRYKVHLSNVIEIEQHEKRGELGQGSLIFETSDLPYGQSVLTTQEIQKNGISIDKNWAFGMGLETTDDSELIYNRSAMVGKTFQIFNAGNVEVHPFETYFKLTIQNVVGASEKFQLLNLTNGSRLNITEPVKTTDKWVYDGPNILRNTQAAAKFTNKNFVHLDPGWNNFQIYYCDSAEVSFDFGFLYR